MLTKEQNSAIVVDCLKGDRKAQYQLYNLYSKAMYNICVRMLKDQMIAEDVLQHAFVDVFRNLRSFKGESTIGAWIKRIVINNCLNHLKKRKLETVELDDGYMQIKEEERNTEVPLNVDHLHKSILQLPEGYRMVLNLYLLEGYDHSEISEILDISESTSKSQYSRAKRKLRELILKNS